MRRISGPAGMLSVEEHGHGPLPILLVHGLAGEASFWTTTIRAVGLHCRLIVPELRGHGRSAPPPDGDYSIEGCAEDVIAVVRGLALERVVLVGHSFGASVAMETAARLPNVVAGLVLLDPAGDFSYLPPEALRSFLAGLDDEGHFAATVDGAIDVALEGATPETERRVRAAIMTAPRPMVRAVYKALLRYDPAQVVDQYPGRILLVTAPANSASFALQMLRPALPHHPMTGVSHWVMMDQPKTVARLIENFLGTL